MKIGFNLPQFNHQAAGIAHTARYARALEDAGAASLWVGDRNLAAVHPKIGYGGMGDTIPAELNPAADPFVLLGVAASATEHVQLGTHVLIAPLYPPVQLARALTSIDLISGGRLLPGFGIGWSPEEYEATGYDFNRRGARMDELLQALETIWTSDPAEYHGEQIEVPLHHSPLKPARKPPIYLGALSERALRRVARHADGWLPLSVAPSWVDTDAMVSQRALIDSLATEAGRDPATIDTVLRVNVDAGTSDEVVADAVRAIHERTGIGHFMIDTMYWARTVDEAQDTAIRLIGLIEKG